MKNYQNLLSCWHKLEHFSPASLPKGKNIKELAQNEPLPWERNLKSNQNNKRIEHTLYLGVFKSKEVTDFIKEYFNDDTKDINQTKGLLFQTCFKVNESGIYLKDSFGITTLNWALGQLEQNQIKSDKWALSFERKKQELLESLEYIFNDYITFQDILTVQNKATEFANWSIEPKLQIFFKTEEKFVSAQNIEENRANAEILNSFYINDLEKILNKSKKDLSNPLKSYLDGSLNKTISKIDLSKHTNEIKKQLEPNKIPDGCWPSDYSLSLMQQYAVNTIHSKLSDAEQSGIFSVNGPPGTGKTTLLRDIISANIVKRAKELVKYEYPYEAFTKIGELSIPNRNYKPFYYSLDDNLCNTGTVIASSNNIAVENVSKELPLKKETGSYKNEIAYFKNVAETCVSKNNWGLISAVLGNKENRNNLVSNIWFNKKEGIADLQNQLKLKNKTIADWDNAKQDFNSILKKVKEEKKEISKCCEDYLQYKTTLKEHKKTTLKLNEIRHEKFNQEQCFNKLQRKKADVESSKKEASEHLSIIKENKPSFFNYWFNKQLRNQYKSNKSMASNNIQQCLQQLFTLSKDITEVNDRLDSLSAKLNTLNNEFSKSYSSLAHYTNLVEVHKSKLGTNFADDEYWQNIDSKSSQVSCPWYSEDLKKYQSELFIAALNLQETFICVANSKSNRIVTSLSAFFEYLKENRSTLTNKEAKALWDVFLLVFPVVSTTFASVQTMFRDLEEGDIPWLFIDEAGQAVPQAAAGTIYRSKRVVVVGDPLQIEPVVTVPAAITNNISNYFSLDNNSISSELSVQTMADRVNPLGMYIGDKWIGTPLKVHRRCLNPMFEIANKIAYDNNMILATNSAAIPSIKFETQFIHCTGSVSGRHWVKEQGKVVKNILIDEINHARKLPNIYVISPFSEVKYELNKFCYGSLFNTYKPYHKGKPDDMKEAFDNWINNSIGTVHTFQGKQAEGVIICLGLDTNSQGAANWAANKPNLLNVALTRAKYRFIAVGDKNIWFKQKYFNELFNLN